MKFVLGIETTCDETAASIVADGKIILSNVIFSQEEIHRAYGGVFPELAARRHIDLILPVIDEAIKQAGISPAQIDLIAVASHPGLMGALLIGVNAAKSLSVAWGKPFVGVNHIEAHLYAAMMGCESFITPSIGLVASGGHTSLVRINDLGSYELLGETIDDAVGEAFDKTARLLGLPYPGGPEIEQLARSSIQKDSLFKPCRTKERPFHFSFSGLKTQALYAIKGKEPLERAKKAAIAYSFQETALNDLVDKSLLALRHFGLKALYVGGGVSNNQRLRTLFEEKKAPQETIFWPPKGLSLDNGAMIAGLGFHLFQKKGVSDPLDLVPFPTNKSLSF